MGLSHNQHRGSFIFHLHKGGIILFQFLYIFGPAAITFLIVGKLAERPVTNYFTAAVEFIAYAALDAAITSLLLIPFNRVELILTQDGIRNIQYGKVAYFLSLILAVIVGIAIAALLKRVDISLHITEKTKDKKNETEEKMD